MKGIKRVYFDKEYCVFVAELTDGAKFFGYTRLEAISKAINFLS